MKRLTIAFAVAGLLAAACGAAADRHDLAGTKRGRVRDRGGDTRGGTAIVAIWQ